MTLRHSLLLSLLLADVIIATTPYQKCQEFCENNRYRRGDLLGTAPFCGQSCDNCSETCTRDHGVSDDCTFGWKACCCREKKVDCQGHWGACKAVYTKDGDDVRTGFQMATCEKDYIVDVFLANNGNECQHRGQKQPCPGGCDIDCKPAGWTDCSEKCESEFEILYHKDGNGAECEAEHGTWKHCTPGTWDCTEAGLDKDTDGCLMKTGDDVFVVHPDGTMNYLARAKDVPGCLEKATTGDSSKYIKRHEGTGDYTLAYGSENFPELGDTWKTCSKNPGCDNAHLQTADAALAALTVPGVAQESGEPSGDVVIENGELSDGVVIENGELSGDVVIENGELSDGVGVENGDVVPETPTDEGVGGDVQESSGTNNNETPDSEDALSFASLQEVQDWCKKTGDNCRACGGKWGAWAKKCYEGRLGFDRLKKCRSYFRDSRLCTAVGCTPKYLKRKAKLKCKGGRSPLPQSV